MAGRVVMRSLDWQSVAPVWRDHCHLQSQPACMIVWCQPPVGLVDAPG